MQRHVQSPLVAAIGVGPSQVLPGSGAQLADNACSSMHAASLTQLTGRYLTGNKQEGSSDATA